MPSTLVTFHAHPDDDAITSGGTMARAKADGHRVVLVVATRGELGENGPASSRRARSLAERRVAETHAAAAILGVDRVEFLGYLDSGMAGEPTNDAPGSFASADVDEAAQRLAASCEKRTPTCSPSTTTTAATAIPITSRCTGSAPRGRDRGHAARVRSDDEPRPLPAPDRRTATGDVADIDESTMPTRRGPRGHRRRRGAHHDDRRRARVRRREARARWPRTRARSARTRSSSRCRTTRSARRSATSGSSTAACPKAPRETSIF